MEKLLVIHSFTYTPDYSDAHISHDNPYNSLRIELHDKFLNFTPPFARTLLANALITLFGYPCYILTQCGTYISTFFSVQARLTLLFKFYKTISIEYNIQQNITIFSSVARGSLNIRTAEMVNDLKDIHPRKRALPVGIFSRISFVNHH